MKKVVLAMLVLMLIFNTVAAYASANYTLGFGEPISCGNVLESTNCVKIATTYINDVPVGLVVVPGNPTILNVVDLNTMKLVDYFEVPNSTSASWMNEMHPNGDVYFGSYTNARLYRFSPKRGYVEDLGRVLSEGAVISMCFDEDAVYMGTYPNAKIVKYTISTGTMTQIADVSNTDQYVDALEYDNGKLYYQTMNNNEGLYVYDIESSKTEVIPFPENSITGAGGIFKRENYLVLLGEKLLLYDLEKKQWHKSIGTNVMGQYVTPVKDGAFYYLDNGYAYKYDFASDSTSRLNMKYGSYMRGGGFVELDDSEMPGLSYINIAYSGNIQVWNFESQKVKSYSNILKGTASETRAFAFGPDKRLYVGEYMGTKAAALDIDTGEIELFHMSQPEGICSLGNKMYFGTYTAAILYILDTEKEYYRTYDKNNPECNPRIWGETGEAQDRPFCMIAAGDKVVQGSIPDYGELGGALSIYDPVTDKMDVYRNLCPNQSPISLAYHDGKVYIGTSVSGGLGIYPSETAAKVMVFDMETREITKSVDMKIPGISADIKGVEGLSVAPDNTLVGYGRGYMFKMDMDTLELVDYKIYGTTNYGNGMQIWKSYNILYDDIIDKAYISIDGKLTILDYKTLEYEITDVDMPTNAIMGPDKNIYYIGNGYKVMKLPVTREYNYDIKIEGEPLNQDGKIISKEDINSLTTVVMRVSNSLGKSANSKVCVAFYDYEKRLVSVKINPVEIVDGEQLVPVELDGAVQNATKMKIFILDNMFAPITKAYVVE